MEKEEKEREKLHRRSSVVIEELDREDTTKLPSKVVSKKKGKEVVKPQHLEAHVGIVSLRMK